MMNFKNHNRPGFTLVEAAISAVIAGSLLGSLLGLQALALQSVVRGYRRTVRIYPMRVMLVEHMFYPKEKKTEITKQIEQPLPSTTLRFESKAVSGEGVFSKFDNIHRLDVTGTWQTFRRKDSLTLVGFVFKPKTKKENK